jgi:hypothetical protein
VGVAERAVAGTGVDPVGAERDRLQQERWLLGCSGS